MKYIVLKLPEYNDNLSIVYEKDSDIEYAQCSMKAMVVKNTDYHKVDVIIDENGKWNFDITTINKLFNDKARRN